MEKFGRETREYMLKELKALFEENPNVFVTSFSSLTVPDLQQLRSSLKNVSSRYVVVKNSIISRILKELDMNEIDKFVGGMCGVVFVGNDPIQASKTLVNFKREHETLDIKGGVLDGSFVSFEKIKELAALPSRQVLLGMVVSTMYSPVTGFVNSLAGIIRKFVYVINAVSQKRKTGG